MEVSFVSAYFAIIYFPVESWIEKSTLSSSIKVLMISFVSCMLVGRKQIWLISSLKLIRTNI